MRDKLADLHVRYADWRGPNIILPTVATQTILSSETKARSPFKYRLIDFEHARISRSEDIVMDEFRTKINMISSRVF